jgi:predicted DsbA family dithiol-disulfide isomerase
MSNALEDQVRGADGRTLPAGPGTPAGTTATLALEVVSDAICPWCWIGKRRLERALSSLGDQLSVDIVWRPFELNPAMPEGGLDRQAYRSAKFGSWERSLALDAQVAEVGTAEGIAFHHDRIERTPNTFKAHRLIRWAGREGRQNDVVEALFAAYFGDGRDIGDAAVLAAIAGEAGLDGARVAAMLAGSEGAAEVRAEIERAAALGISGVPTVMASGRPLFSGAIRPELIARHLRRAAGRE